MQRVLADFLMVLVSLGLTIMLVLHGCIPVAQMHQREDLLIFALQIQSGL
jgi:hypothetical protein